MKNEEVLKNCVVLTGPMSVGKSLVSSELSKKTGMEVVSIDDVLGFAYAELYYGLHAEPNYLSRFYKTTLNTELKRQKKTSNLSLEELEEQITQRIDNYIDEYIRLKFLLGSFEEVFPILKRYYRIFNGCSNLNADTCLALFQEKSTLALDVISKKLKQPVIIDTPAFLGWKIPDFNFRESDTKSLSRLSYHETPQSIEKATRKILDKFGPKIFLTPGIDYSKRQNVDSTTNFILLDLIDQYAEYADIEVSVNNMFYDENDESLKIREWFNAESHNKRQTLKNNSELSNICDSILSRIEELNNQKSMQ